MDLKDIGFSVLFFLIDSMKVLQNNEMSKIVLAKKQKSLWEQADKMEILLYLSSSDMTN